MHIRLFSTFPSSRNQIWQLDLIPCAALLRNRCPKDPYWSFTLQWLFWTLNFQTQ